MNQIPNLKATVKDLRRWLLLQVWKKQFKTTKNMKNQGNMSLPKNNNSPITELKGKGVWIKKSKSVLKKLNELPENSKYSWNHTHACTCTYRNVQDEILLKRNHRREPSRSSAAEELNKWNKKCNRVEQMEDKKKRMKNCEEKLHDLIYGISSKEHILE